MSESAIDKLCREAREAVDAIVAERDQLRQQVEKLLSAIEERRVKDGTLPVPSPRRIITDGHLYQAADQVRKELEW